MALITNRQESDAVHAFFCTGGRTPKSRKALRNRLIELAMERPERVERFAELDPALDDETAKLLQELLHRVRKVRLD